MLVKLQVRSYRFVGKNLFQALPGGPYRLEIFNNSLKKMLTENYFYSAIGTDLSKVVWGHAVNSQQLLEHALSSTSPIMMLEADVIKGSLIGESVDQPPIPIMAHPPIKTSDISLEMWIKEVIHVNKKTIKKGVKLDFKVQDILHESLELLKKYDSEIKIPIWLNADILAGPGGDSKTIDPDFFLSACSSIYPDATLSLGWTTNFLSKEDQKYTKEMIDKMATVLNSNNVSQSVTFSVRAAFVGKSLEDLHSLAQLYPETSFTVWTNASDEVDIESLVTFQHIIGEHKVYFDLSEDEKLQFQDIRRCKFSNEHKNVA